jgi:hypothetical protein
MHKPILVMRLLTEVHLHRDSRFKRFESVRRDRGEREDLGFKFMLQRCRRGCSRMYEAVSGCKKLYEAVRGCTRL